MTAYKHLGRGIAVLNGNWGAATLAGIGDVLQSVYDALTEAFQEIPDKPIEVSRWPIHHPKTISDSRLYHVRLTAHDTYWSMYAREFAGELCRILTGFGRFKEHKHRWFDQAVSELASLYALHCISESWAKAPPASVYKALEFAPYHRQYAERIEQQLSSVADSPLSKWLPRNMTRLEADRCDHALGGVVAVVLLPLFRREPTLWRECGLLNTWDPSASRSFSEYLDAWTDRLGRRGLAGRVPRHLRCLLGLGRGTERVAPLSLPDEVPPTK